MSTPSIAAWVTSYTLARHPCGTCLGRLRAHLTWNETVDAYQPKETANNRAFAHRLRQFQVIRVNEPYQAPSLEEYLIEKLRPRYNGTGDGVRPDKLRTEGVIGTNLLYTGCPNNDACDRRATVVVRATDFADPVTDTLKLICECNDCGHKYEVLEVRGRMKWPPSFTREKRRFAPHPKRWDDEQQH